jgi:hypothetical protein
MSAMNPGVIDGVVIGPCVMRGNEMSSGVVLCEMSPGERNLGALIPCERKTSRLSCREQLSLKFDRDFEVLVRKCFSATVDF